MKFNFWQIVGLVLIIAGAAWWFHDYNRQNPAPTTTSTTAR